MEELNPDQVISSLKHVSLQPEPDNGKVMLLVWVVGNLPMVLPPGVQAPDYVGALEQLAIYIQRNTKDFDKAGDLAELRARVKELKGTAGVEVLGRALEGVPVLKTHDYEEQVRALRKLESPMEGIWLKASKVLRGAPKELKKEARTLFNRRILRKVLASKEWGRQYLSSEVSEVREELLRETGEPTLGNKELTALGALEKDNEALSLGPFTFEERMVTVIIAARLDLDGDEVSQQLAALDEFVDKLERQVDKRVAFRKLWGLDDAARIMQDDFDTLVESLPKLLPDLLRKEELADSIVEWTKAFDQTDGAQVRIDKRRGEWRERWIEHRTIEATQAGQPIWGGLCLSSSSKVAAYLLQHPDSGDKELATYLKTETIEQLKALDVPEVLWPRGKRAFFALQERLVHVRYSVDFKSRRNAVFEQFGLKPEERVELGDRSLLAREVGVRVRPAEENGKTIAGGVWKTHEERGVEGRAVYTLSFKVALGVGHAIEIDLDSERDIYSFWDPNFGRYTFGSVEEFQDALAGLLFVIYPATEADLVPHLGERF